MAARLFTSSWREFTAMMGDGCVNLIITDLPSGQIHRYSADQPQQDVLEECLRMAEGSVIWLGEDVLRLGKYDPPPDVVLAWTPEYMTFSKYVNGIREAWFPIAVWRAGKQEIIKTNVLTYAADDDFYWTSEYTKPLSLYRQLIRAFSEGTVLDPFMRYGSAGLAAVQVGFDFVGREDNIDAFTIATQRLMKLCEVHLEQG